MNEPKTDRTLNLDHPESWIYQSNSGFSADICTPEGVPITELPQPC